MKIHRFIGDYNLNKKKIAIYDKALVRQLRHVLRLKKAEKIILVDKNLKEALCSIDSYRKDAVLVNVEGARKVHKIDIPIIVLYCAILKRTNFELVVQKGTEIGIFEFVPIISKRTVKKNIKKERIERIIKEAVEQSGRVDLPVLQDIMTFQDARAHAEENTRNILLHVKGKPLTFLSERSKEGKIGIFIAPEGGWDPSEREIAQDSDFEIISLGEMVLRSETAAIISSYLAVCSLL